MTNAPSPKRENRFLASFRSPSPAALTFPPLGSMKIGARAKKIRPRATLQSAAHRMAAGAAWNTVIPTTAMTASGRRPK